MLVFFSLPLENFTAEKCTVWINENVTNYGNYNLYSKVWANAKYAISSCIQNGFTYLTEIWNQDFLGYDTSFEEIFPF